MEKQQTELASKVKALRFRLGKTDEAINKDDREACERQRTSIKNISTAVIRLKETIEEKKFAKGESEEEITKWAEDIERELSITDECVKKLTQKLAEINIREEEAKAVIKHQSNLKFEQELLEQKLTFEKAKPSEKDDQNNTSTSAKSRVKLPELQITKFNGKVEQWLPFWGKFTSEIDSTDIPTLRKFSYLKEFLETPVRAEIDGLPFTSDGYEKAKAILESEYGQTTEVVNSYVQNIMSLPVINGANPKKITDFYRQLRYNVQSLETLGKLADVKGNVRSTLDKLKGIKSDLVRGNEGWQDWGFKELLDQLKKWRDIHPEEYSPEKSTTTTTSRRTFLHTRDSRRDTRACVYCEDTTHKCVDCTKVVSVDDRKKILARKGLCFNCTGAQHQAANCKNRSTCRKCNRKHHTSVCSAGSSGAPEETSEKAPKDKSLLTATEGEENVVVYPVVIVAVEGIKCRALLDTGAGSSYVSAALLEKLPKRERKQEVRKIDMMLGTTTRKMELQTVKVASTSGQFEMTVEVTKVDKGELVSLNNPKYSELIRRYPHLKDVVMEDTDTKEQLPVHLILGACEYAKLKTSAPAKIGIPGQPVAELTQCGWTIMSPGKEGINESNLLLTQTSHVEYEKLCRLDVLGLEDKPANDQSSVYDEFKEQLVRNDEGWYETGLPWRGDHQALPNNEVGSLQRLQSLTKKLQRQQLATQYKEIIDDQKETGVVETADQPAVGREYYIPHKPVLRPEAESTKIRVVYDASAKAHENAPSLNDCLHTGPPLQNKLWNVLVRNRFYPVALSGDMQKAFLQVRIKAQDRDALRFHWRESSNSKLETLRFTRALFGLTASPFLLGGVIETHLNHWEMREPETVTKLKRELYVDDLISGSNTVEQGLQLKKKSCEIFQDGGFPLHKWHSNEPALESNGDPLSEPTYAKQHLGKADGGEASLLGTGWKKDGDKLSISIPKGETVPTKRGVLSRLAKVYDPLGMVSPATFRGKLLFREVCDAKKAWDEPITDGLLRKLTKWENELPSSVEFPRSLAIYQEQIDAIHLHSFGDASGSGVAACIYAVVHQPSGTNQGLVAARSRLAKPGLTIPRLELVAAHMAVNLAQNVREALTNFPVSTTTCWSDSSVVLYWLRGTETYKQFVANRVRKIREHKGIEWRHVTTNDNPADVGSRGDQFEREPLWWNGPKWLPDPNRWPLNIVSEPSKESSAETKPVQAVANVAITQPNDIDMLLEKFSLQKATRVCTWIRRFMNNALARGRERKGPLTTNELNHQRKFWIQRAQKSGSVENDRVPLNLQVNEDSVLVCRGRIQGENPIYIPDDHTLAQKIVEEAHLVTLHGGIGLTMTQVRKKYWIPRLRRLVRKVRKRCHGCKRFRVSAYATPSTGVLPTTRTQGVNPYEVIGVDYAGPIRYRKANGREGKSYVLLYACSLTRGVYIDLLPSMELTEFLMSLKRFIARRGRPSRIYSDNGGTFVGAAKWMRAVEKDEKIQSFLGEQQIVWQFNLSRAPWWGGQFERIIGLIKAALNKTIGNGYLKWKELEEVLIDVEVTLNNRPLSYVEDDLELPILTPSSMLFLNSNTVPELESHRIEDKDLRKRAKHLLKCKRVMWKRWSQEYLRSLRERHRNLTGPKGAEPTVGDVVVLKTDEKNRGKWPLGVIEELIPGRDGVIRVAKVRTGKSLLERAVQHLFPLELSCDREKLKPTTTPLNPEAKSFRPKRKAAEAAAERIRQLSEDD